MIRDQSRTTKVSLSSQDLTSILDKYVLHLVGVPLTSLLERYVRLGMARRCPWSFLSPSRRTELRVSLRAHDTRVDGLQSRFSRLCGSTPAQKIRAESVVFTPHKIRAELSSNGYPLELRTGGFTPHLHAELPSNGSSRPAFARILVRSSEPPQIRLGTVTYAVQAPYSSRLQPDRPLVETPDISTTRSTRLAQRAVKV